MSWNHRVIEITDKDDCTFMRLCEVYYNKAGKPRAYCEGTVCWDEGEDPSKILAQFKAALDKPWLKESDFE